MTTSDSLIHRLDRTVVIRAPRETVFRFFTDSRRWAEWWGTGSRIDARSGGEVFIRYPDGTEVTGHVVEIVAPERIVFTYGYVSGSPIPPGGSVVMLRLEQEASRATRLHLSHHFAESAVRDQHVQGWRFQLSLFGNVVADDLHSGAGDTVDTWFAAWSAADPTERQQLIDRVAAKEIHLRDRFSLIDGIDDLREHLTMVLRFASGVRIQREGDIRHCQGTVLADWIARTADGEGRGRGTNVFLLNAEGQIECVTGFRSGVQPRT